MPNGTHDLQTDKFQFGHPDINGLKMTVNEKGHQKLCSATSGLLTSKPSYLLNVYFLIYTSQQITIITIT